MVKMEPQGSMGQLEKRARLEPMGIHGALEHEVTAEDQEELEMWEILVPLGQPRKRLVQLVLSVMLDQTVALEHQAEEVTMERLVEMEQQELLEGTEPRERLAMQDTQEGMEQMVEQRHVMVCLA